MLVVASACTAALAADPPQARHCILVAGEHEMRGRYTPEIADALQYDARLATAALMGRMLADRLVANTFSVDADERSVVEDKVAKTRATTGCDTLVELRTVFWGGPFGSAFGFDLVGRHSDGQASKVLLSRQYRYDTDKSAQFSYDGFAEMVYRDLRATGALDDDREAMPVAPAAVRAEYDRFAAAWPTHRDEYHLRQIVRSTQLLASLAIARLHDRNPPDFAVLAADSDDAASKANGGDMGWVPPSDLPPEIAQAVTARRGPGLVDRPIEAADGWHVIEVLDRHDAHPPSFDSLRERIAANLRWNAVVPPAIWAAALKD
jgi:hypothetical protein